MERISCIMLPQPVSSVFPQGDLTEWTRHTLSMFRPGASSFVGMCHAMRVATIPRQVEYLCLHEASYDRTVAHLSSGLGASNPH